MKRVLSLVLLVVYALATPLAWGADPVESPQVLFERGKAAYGEGRYEVAVDMFLKAYAGDPQPALLYNVAQAYERLGDTRNALRAYRDFLRQEPTKEEAQLVGARVENLERRIREGSRRPISVFSAPGGASVELDGKEVGKTPWTGEVEPGRHAVVIRLGGHADLRKDVLVGDRAVDLDVTLTPLAAASPAEAAPAGQPPPPGRPRGVRPLTWVAFGVGAAALGTSVIFEMLRSGAESDARKAPTQLGHAGHYRTMEDRQTAARILAGVGAAAVVAGGVLLYFDLNSSAPGDVTPRVAVGCGPSSCDVAGQISF